MSGKAQRKKWHPMVFYIIYDADMHYVFANKSQNPVTSVRHHFHRSKNPNRHDYNCDFYTWLRSKPQEEFIITYCTELPECIDRRAHLTTLPPDAVLPPIITYEELYEKLLEERNQ